LRYGIPDAPDGLLPAEQMLLERFRSLSPHQQHLVEELVAQLALD
jgi:hypothetical protein